MKILKKYHSIFIAFFIIALTLSSCAKINQDRIDGTWTRYKPTNINPEFDEFWVFRSSEVIIEKEEMVIMPGDTIATLQRVEYERGFYEVSANIGNTFVKLSGFDRDEFYTFNKKWEIVDLDKEIFSLSSTVGPGAQFIEFYRD